MKVLVLLVIMPKADLATEVHACISLYIIVYHCISLYIIVYHSISLYIIGTTCDGHV